MSCLQEGMASQLLAKCLLAIASLVSASALPLGHYDVDEIHVTFIVEYPIGMSEASIIGTIRERLCIAPEGKHRGHLKPRSSIIRLQTCRSHAIVEPR